MRHRLVIFLTIVLCSIAWGQAQTGQNQNGQQSMENMPGMSGHDMSNMQGSSMPGSSMKDMPMGGDKDTDSDASAHAMHSMEGHMDMGPHMKMTALRKPQPGDAERAQQIVTEARKAAEKYMDYRVALDEGFKIFHPEIPQQIYHFTSGRNAVRAQFVFDPERPTSLLYEKHSDGYKLVGVMYTAPKIFTEDQLNERVPLSVAQWHEHVNFCRPPADMAPAEKREAYLGKNAKFGLKGSIDTREACDAAGGAFIPVVFNWMVHVYPFEKDQAAIWSVERQHGDAD